MRLAKMPAIACLGLWLGACDSPEGPAPSPATAPASPYSEPKGAPAASTAQGNATCFDDGEHEICVDPDVGDGVWAGPRGQLRFVPAVGSIATGRRGIPIVKMSAGHPLQAKAQLHTAPTGALRATCKATTRQYRRNKTQPALPPPGPASQPPFDVCALIGVRAASSTRTPAGPEIQ